MADKKTGAPEVDVDPKAPDESSDKNFDYEQPVDAKDGVPMKDWIAEQPFDSAEYLDKPRLRYASDAKGEGGDQPAPDQPTPAE